MKNDGAAFPPIEKPEHTECVFWLFVMESERGSGFKVQGSRFRVQGSRFRALVAASPPFLEDGILVSSAFPSRGRCPEGADRALTA